MAKIKRLTGLFKKKRPTADAKILITKGGRTNLDESYNRLKDNVLHFGALGNKVIQVESSIAGEGTTTIASNLAVSLAFNSKKVLVLDLDFRRPGISKVFGVEEALGFGDYVLEDAPLESVIKHTEYGVDVVTRGRTIYNSSYVLNSEKMKKFIEELKEKYDFILLTAEGTMPGVIAREMHGSNGFGYDPVLFLPECGKCVAELTAEEKNSISHRGVALRRLADGYYGLR